MDYLTDFTDKVDDLIQAVRATKPHVVVLCNVTGVNTATGKTVFIYNVLNRYVDIARIRQPLQWYIQRSPNSVYIVEVETLDDLRETFNDSKQLHETFWFVTSLCEDTVRDIVQDTALIIPTKPVNTRKHFHDFTNLDGVFNLPLIP